MYDYDLYGENYKINIFRSHYVANGNTAVVANTAEGEPFAEFSVNLTDLPEDQIYVDTNNLRGALEFLTKNKLAQDMNETLRSGYCEYPLVKIDLNKIPEIKVD